MQSGSVVVVIDFAPLFLLLAHLFGLTALGPWQQVGSKRWLFIRNSYEAPAHVRVLDEQQANFRDYNIAPVDSLCTNLAFIDQRIFIVMRVDGIKDAATYSIPTEGPGETHILLGDTTRPAEFRCPLAPLPPIGEVK